MGILQRKDPKAHADASLHALLDASDAPELFEWLRHRPLIHTDTALGWTMVHAGLAPEWTQIEATERAHELEIALRAPDYANFLRDLFGNKPNRWAEATAPIERLRYIANALTRIRFVDAGGGLHGVEHMIALQLVEQLRAGGDVAGERQRRDDERRVRLARHLDQSRHGFGANARVVDRVVDQAF